MAVQSSVERVKTINTDILAFDSKQNNSKQKYSPDLGIDSFTINFAATDRRNQDPIRPRMLRWKQEQCSNG